MALGATRWEMVRGVAIPQVSGGLVAAVMLGFGRAVGEAIAVAQVIGGSLNRPENIYAPADTMASRLAAPVRRHSDIASEGVARIPGGDPARDQPRHEPRCPGDRAPYPAKARAPMSAAANPLDLRWEARSEAQAHRSGHGGGRDGGCPDRGRGARDRSHLRGEAGRAGAQRRFLHPERSAVRRRRAAGSRMRSSARSSSPGSPQRSHCPRVSCSRSSTPSSPRGGSPKRSALR